MLTDLLALQSEVAAAVAEGVGLRLPRRAIPPIVRENPQAQEAYLQGRYLLLNNLSRDNFISAREYLERSVQIDPANARALTQAWRAVTRSWISTACCPGARPRAWRPRAAATRAVHLDDVAAGGAQSVCQRRVPVPLGLGARRRGVPARYRAESQLQLRAFRIRPLSDGRQPTRPGACSRRRRAQEQDPLSPEATGVVGLSLFYARKLRRGDRPVPHGDSDGSEFGPAPPALGRAYAANGQFEPGHRGAAVRGDDLRTGAVHHRRAGADLRGGWREPARAGLDRSAHGRRSHATGPRSPPNITPTFGQRSANPIARSRGSTKPVSDREFNLLWARVDPRFDSLRSDPRFAVFLGKLAPIP